MTDEVMHFAMILSLKYNNYFTIHKLMRTLKFVLNVYNDSFQIKVFISV